jgi:cell division protease FtsH
MKNGWKYSSLLYIAFLALLAYTAYSLFTTGPESEKIGLSTAIELSQSNNVGKAVLVPEESLLTLTVVGAPSRVTNTSGDEIILSDGQEVVVDVGYHNIPELVEIGLVLPADFASESKTGLDWGTVLINFLPILIFGALLVFLFRSARGANSQAMSFGRSKARLFPASTPTVTFNDVAGVEEAKQELMEVVDFLKSREKFQELGARIPRGVLLIGPPGTGKTLMSKAVAGEAGVPFFSISGSEFVEMFVGVGASRVRDLFEQAKRNRPCLIFIDEIDAVGRHRGSGMGGSHDEREQTLNQILTEMDGFDTSTGVIVLAATNRPDILDPALLRPGRFDRRVMLDRPDIVGRSAILKVHAAGKPLAKDVNLEVVAKQTVGFSGAELANVINEAAILAARRNKTVISMDEMNESVDRVMAGPERKSRKISEKEKKITAYHEVGHALVGHLLPNADPIQKITIIPRGMAGGYTKSLPTEDRYMLTRSEIIDRLAMMLAGRAAEDIIFADISTGAHDDLHRATELARKMVVDYGMSDKLGPRTFGNKQEMVFLGREITEQRDFGDKVADQIDEEIHQIITQADETAHKILDENRDRLDMLAEKLLVDETIDGTDLEKLLNGEKVKASPKKTPKKKPAVAKSASGKTGKAAAAVKKKSAVKVKPAADQPGKPAAND